MNRKNFFVIDEDFSSQGEAQKISPINGNDIINFYRRKEGNKYVCQWYDVTGNKPALIKEIVSARKITTVLFAEDFAVIEEQKVQGLPKLKCYQLFIRSHEGDYVDISNQLTGGYAIVCKGHRCVITSVTRVGEVYELHFRAKGFDRSQCYRKDNGNLYKISDSEARRLRSGYSLNERAERLCRSSNL